MAIIETTYQALATDWLGHRILEYSIFNWIAFARKICQDNKIVAQQKPAGDMPPCVW